MRFLKFLGVVALFLVLLLGVYVFALEYWGIWHDEWSGYNASRTIGNGVCNIAVVDIHGTIMSYDDGYEATITTPQYVRSVLEQATYEPGIYGVLLDIDSRGGGPVPSEAIMRAVEKANTYLYSAAVIGDYGTSGGYLAAAGAEKIFASPFSDVGGIGITMSYLSLVNQNVAEGLEYEELSSAPFKDYGSPNRPLSDTERALIERDLDYYHNHFIDLVADKRGLPREDVVVLADGSSLPGELALESGLIDSLGDRYDAQEWFAQQLEVSPEEVIFCD